MKVQFASDSIKWERISCPGCTARNVVEVIRVIDTEELVGQFLAGRFNQTTCVSCGSNVVAPFPITVQQPNLPGRPVDFLPVQCLAKPQMVEWLVRRDRRIPLAHTRAELFRIMQLHLNVSEQNHRYRVSHRKIVIPEEVMQRIGGTYRKAKLKTIWFLSTCFSDGRPYSVEEVDLTIRRALLRMDQTAGGSDVSQWRAALRELEFLASADGRVFWNIPQQEG